MAQTATAAVGLYNNVLTATRANKSKDLKEQWANKHVMLKAMELSNAIVPDGGGSSFIVPLTTVADPTVGTTGDWDPVALTDVEILRAGEYLHKQITGAATVNQFEISDNDGVNKIVDLYGSRIDNVMLTIRDNFNRLAITGTNAGNDMGGLAHIVDITPATGVVAGIDPSVDTWWQNISVNAAGAFATVGLPSLRDVRGQVNRGSGMNTSTFNLTDQDGYDAYETLAQPLQRYHGALGSQLAEAGFQTLEWGGAPIAWDTEVPSGYWYTINFDDFKFRCDERYNFSIGESRELDSQFVVSSKCAHRGNFCTGERRNLGVIYGLTY